MSVCPRVCVCYKIKVHIFELVCAPHPSPQTTDSSSLYLEGVHWVKGRLIGTGAFCSCFLARDVKNGTMFAVKQSFPELHAPNIQHRQYRATASLVPRRKRFVSQKGLCHWLWLAEIALEAKFRRARW